MPFCYISQNSSFETVIRLHSTIVYTVLTTNHWKHVAIATPSIADWVGTARISQANQGKSKEIIRIKEIGGAWFDDSTESCDSHGCCTFFQPRLAPVRSRLWCLSWRSWLTSDLISTSWTSWERAPSQVIKAHAKTADLDKHVRSKAKTGCTAVYCCHCRFFHVI